MNHEEKKALELLDDASKFFNRELFANKLPAATEAQNREIARLAPPQLVELLAQCAAAPDLDDTEIQHRARVIFTRVACGVMGLAPLSLPNRFAPKS